MTMLNYRGSIFHRHQMGTVASLGLAGAPRVTPSGGGDTLMKVLNIFGDKFIKKEILDKRSPGVSGDSGL